MTTVDDWNWDEVAPADEISLADEIKGMSEINLSKRTGRTDEEIKQFSVDDNLSDTEKYLYIIKNGAMIQKCSLIRNLKRISMGIHRDFCFDKLLSAILQNLKIEPLAVQREVGVAIEEIISRLPAQKVNEIIEIAKIFLKYKNEEVSKVWKDVFISCIKKIPSDEILPEAIADLSLGQPAQFRIWSGRLLGTIICRLDPKKIDQNILQKFINLCEDTDYEVRKSMCFHLNAVIKNIGVANTKKYIFPVYLELLKDEEISVQTAAIINYTNYGEFMDQEQRASTFIPYWKKIVEDNNPKLSQTIAELFGVFLWSAREELKDPERKYFVAYYQTMAVSSDENIRRFCAFNYPAVVKALKPEMIESYKLEKLLSSFVYDECEAIPISLASFFHEITDMLGTSCYRILKETFPRIVLSKNKHIYTPLFRNIEKILNNFLRDPTFKQGNNSDAIFKLILEKRKSFDNSPNIDWRLHLLVLNSFNSLLSIIDSETLYEQHSALLFKLITDNFPVTIKIKAIKILVSIFRNLRKLENQENLLRQLLGIFLLTADLKEEQSCHIRILFIDVCECILEQFSRKFFREYFLASYFALSRDPIPNVRLKYVALLPMVRHIIRLPTDSLLLSKLIDATEPLATRDSDNEVMASMSRFYAQNGLLNQENCCQKPANAPKSFGLEAFGTERMKVSTSNESITDPYLFYTYKWETLDPPEKDQQKEDMEGKYFVNLTIKKKEIVKKITVNPTRKIETATSKNKINTAKKPDQPPKPPTPTSKTPSFKKGKRHVTLETPPIQVKKDEVKLMEGDIKKVVKANSEKNESMLIDGDYFKRDITGDHPVYAVFTSGSTGKPKGVVIKHSSLCDYVQKNGDWCEIGKGNRVAQLASIMFDVSVSDIFTTLLRGATLVLRSSNDYFKIFDKVDRVDITPAALAKMDITKDYGNLRIMVGGEALPFHLKEKWCNKYVISNAYGPSEVTVSSSIALMEAGKRITIGKPMANTFQYIVDSDCKPVPIGVAGELVIGGPGVALGYLNRPDLTAERFIPNHFLNDGSKMYKSGDLCKWNAEGDIEILGRMDDMVKVKGYRIELDEVSLAIDSYPSVISSTVLVINDMLVGFLAPKTVNIDSLRQHIDKKALKSMEIKTELEPPATEKEIRLASIWSEILKVDLEKIGRNTSFFELGGDSIVAVQLGSKARSLGLELETSTIFKNPTLKLMAQTQSAQTATAIKPFVASESIVNQVQTLVASNVSAEQVYPATALQAGMIALTLQDRTAYFNQEVFRASEAVDVYRLKQAAQKVIQSHDILRTRFVHTAEGIYQVLSDKVECELETADNLQTYYSDNQQRGFTSEDKYWFRLGLVRENGSQYLVVTLHHILYDGWCAGYFINDIMKAYQGEAVEKSPPFKNVIDYQQSQDKASVEKYWTEYIGNPDYDGRIPKMTGPSAEVGNGEVKIQIPRKDIDLVSRKFQITASTLMKAAWALTLKMFTQKDELIFGNVVSGRDIPVTDVDKIIGSTINTIPCVVSTKDANRRIIDVVQGIQDDYIRGIPYSYAGLSDIQKWVNITDESMLIDGDYFKRDITGDHPVYAVFTSGSTGKPKGVVIKHSSLCDYVQKNGDWCEIGKGNRVAQLASIMFDVSVSDIFTTLLRGATLVLRSSNDYFKIFDKVDRVDITPAALAKMDITKDYGNLRIMVGGEALPFHLKEKWCNKYVISNAYGPSEVTVSSSIALMEAGKRITIGKPMANTFQYIVDSDCKPVPIGVAGELVIGGPGVALGYLNRPDLTAERFIPNHFLNDGSKMYKSGDLCKWNAEGDIEILGRMDDMVKVKGYRIELDEVSLAIDSYPSVISSTVLVINDMLVGFLAPKTVNIDSLRQHVLEILPPYMAPTTYICLKELPMNNNGKIDKKALKSMEIKTELEPPATEKEIRLASIWSEILKVDLEKIGRNTSFFELGGDSIVAVQLGSKARSLGLELETSTIFKNPTLKLMAQTQSAQTATAIKPFVASESIVNQVQTLVASNVSAEQVYPATALQAGMIALTLQDRTAYFNQEVFRASEAVDVYRLKQAAQKVIQSHDILRTRFVHTAEGIYQVLSDKVECELETADNLQTYYSDNQQRGFTSEDKYWFRLGLVRENGSQYLVVTLHHILYDGWCAGYFINDIMKAYQGEAVEKSPPFKNVIDYQQSQDKTSVEKYWTEYIGNPDYDGRIPKMTGPSAEVGNGEVKIQIPRKDIDLVSRKFQITASTLMKAAWALTLKMFTQKDELIFGNVVSGRDIPVTDVDKIIGSTINTIPCVVSTKDANRRIIDVVQGIQDDYIRGIPYSYAGLSDIQKWKGIGNQMKLFHTNLVYENYPEEVYAEAGLFTPTSSTTQLDQLNNTFDVQILFFPGKDTITADFLYDEAVFNQYTLEKVSGYFDYYLSRIVESLATNGGQDTVIQTCIIPSLEKQQILEYGKGPTQKIEYSIAHKAFEDCARNDPDCVAVEDEDKHITYGELDRRADCVAAGLIKRGLQVGDFVAIVTKRSIEMIIAIMGVLKAGGAYVPVDMELPFSRIEYILETASCHTILCHSEISKDLLKKLPHEKLVNITDESMLIDGDYFKRDITGDHPVYAVFTSGSTGKPKGVVIKHSSLCDYVQKNGDWCEIGKGNRVAQLASIMFDVSVSDIFTTLLRGATLVLRSSNDYFKIFDKVDRVDITPAALAKMDITKDYGNLRIMVGGEALPFHLKEKWCNKYVISNAYGPSEVTVSSSIALMEAGKRITIGKPMANTFQYIVDSDCKPVPIGVAGELVIGGPGVALGYLNRPDLTAERFIPNHFLNDGSKMYKSGDLCKWNAEGDIEILGRMDDMVKVKGYRIELDEVSLAIDSYPSVISSTVLVINDMLVGFLAPKTVNIDSLRQHIDKKALKSMEIKTELEPPATEKEIRLANIWSEILKVDLEKIGRNTSFFELGGDSIVAVQLGSKARSLGLELETSTIFKNPTLKLMAQTQSAQTATAIKPFVASESIVNQVQTLVASNVSAEQVYPATALQAGMIALTLQDRTAYFNQEVFRASEAVDVYRLKQAAQKVIQSHDILRTRFVHTAEGIYQVLSDKVECELETADNLQTYYSDNQQRGFTSEDKYWFRLGLVRENGSQYLVVTLHHILYDGWCAGYFINDIMKAYQGEAVEKSPPFKNVIDYQQSQDKASVEKYWTEYIGNPDYDGRIPKMTGPSAEVGNGEVKIQIPRKDIDLVSRKFQITASTLMKAAWALTLKMFTQKDELIFGNVVSGRDIPVTDVDKIIGSTINTIPCVVSTKDANRRIIDVVQGIQDDYIRGIPYSYAGLSDIQKWKGIGNQM
ncbi:hypothetical protein HDV06_000853, partial [Boothiomyces sp. JEL0866]